MHFLIAYFLGENSKFGIETSHTVRDDHWFTEKRKKWVSNLLFEKQNLAKFNNFATQKWRIEGLVA